MQLWVNELFTSISGEVGGFPQGSMATFIRLGGCNLKCDFCDAPESQDLRKSKPMAVKDIFAIVSGFTTKNIVITGGEPLTQMAGLIDLVEQLWLGHFNISIETNGTIEIPEHFLVRNNITIVMDYKLRVGSGIPVVINQGAFSLPLRDTDFLKFVVADKEQMEMAMQIHKLLYSRGMAAQVAYSPMVPFYLHKGQSSRLIEYLSNGSAMITSHLRKSDRPGILNIQLHKILDMP